MKFVLRGTEHRRVCKSAHLFVRAHTCIRVSVQSTAAVHSVRSAHESTDAQKTQVR